MAAPGMAALAQMGDPPWSKTAMRRLGSALRSGLPIPENAPSYEAVMMWYDELAVLARGAIESMDWPHLLPGRDRPLLTSRPKTIGTLVEKLRRSSSYALGSIQDIAGVRFECEMSLEEQDVVANAIADAFDQDRSVCIKDLRVDHHSGYRAVHVSVSLPQGRVEVQVRTHIQGAWANVFESLGDIVGRDIRYGGQSAVPDAQSFVDRLINLSVETGAELERWRQEAIDQEQELSLMLSEAEASSNHTVAKDTVIMLHRLDELRLQIKESERIYAENLGNAGKSLEENSVPDSPQWGNVASWLPS